MSEAKNLFCLTWKGSKIPRGTKVGGIDIVWTQHGRVIGNTASKDPSEQLRGQDLGSYTRTQEFGGPGKDEHTMIILTTYDSVTAPDGTPCKPLNKEAA